MPSFTGSYNPSVGPLTQVCIVPYSDSANVPRKFVEESLYFFAALIDTGASTTCLSQKVVDTLKMEPVGQAPMMGATGQKTVNQYAFQVGFVHGQQQMSDGTFNGHMATVPTQGMQFDAGGSAFEVLLGRDVLCQGLFTMSFDGHWCFSF